MKLSKHQPAANFVEGTAVVTRLTPVVPQMSGAGSPSVLGPIDAFCTPAAGEDVHANALSEVITADVGVKRIVELSQPYLTHADGHVRRRCTLLLAQIIRSSVDGLCSPLDRNTAAQLCQFFTSRLHDPPSVSPCLAALTTLVVGPPTPAWSPPLDAAAVVEGIFEHLIVTEQEQAVRQVVFEFLRGVLTIDAYKAQIDEKAPDFVGGFVGAMEGEKDPRCLVACLSIAKTVMAKYGTRLGPLVDEVFDVTSCYFPVTFTPPPNSPYKITKQQLAHALLDVFASSEAFAGLALPMIASKLASPVVDAKMDSMDLLAAAAAVYGVKALAPFLSQFASLLSLELTNSQGGPGAAIAASAITAVARTVAQDAERTGDLTHWETFIGSLLNKCVREVAVGPETLLGRSSMQVCKALACATPRTLSAVAEQLMPVLLACLASDLPARRTQVLRCLMLLAEAIDANVDAPVGAHPLSPYVSSILSAASPFVFGTSHPQLDTALPAAQVMALLCVRPPSPLLTGSQIADLLSGLVRVIVDQPEDALRLGCIHVLAQLAGRSKTLTDLALAHAVPQLIGMLGADGPDAVCNRTCEALTELCTLPAVARLVVPKVVLQVVRVVDSVVTPVMPARVPVFTALPAMVTKCAGASVATLTEFVIPAADQATAVVPTLLHLLLRNAFGTCLQGPPLVALLTCRFADESVEALPAIVWESTAAVLRSVIVACSADAAAAVQGQVLQAFLGSESSVVRGFTPLLPGVASRQYLAMPLLTACLLSPHAIASADALFAALSTFISAAIDSSTGVPAGAFEAACQAACLTLNKQRNAEVLAGMVAMATHTLQQHQAAARSCSSETQAGLLVSSLTWLSRAIVTRWLPESPIVLNLLLDILTGDAAYPWVVVAGVAHGIGMLVSDDPVLFNRSHGAVVAITFKQRTFLHAFKVLALRSTTGAPLTDGQVAGLCSLWAALPRDVVQSEQASVVPLVLQGLSSSKPEVRVLALQAVQSLVAMDPVVVSDHLETVLPALLDLCITGSRPSVRAASIDTICKLADLPYHKVYPFRPRVIKQLAVALDDPKRAVRVRAARCRNDWLALSKDA